MGADAANDWQLDTISPAKMKVKMFIPSSCVLRNNSDSCFCKVEKWGFIRIFYSNSHSKLGNMNRGMRLPVS